MVRLKRKWYHEVYATCNSSVTFFADIHHSEHIKLKWMSSGISFKQRLHKKSFTLTDIKLLFDIMNILCEYISAYNLFETRNIVNKTLKEQIIKLQYHCQGSDS